MPLIFVIHSVNVLDAAPATAVQGSLYGEERALHYRATSFTVLLRVNQASLQRCEGHLVTLKALIGLIYIYTHTYIYALSLRRLWGSNAK